MTPHRLWGAIVGIALIATGPSPVAWAQAPTTTQQTVEALYQAANRLDAGREVLQDFAKARALYQQAAETGHAGAQNQFGKYLHAGRGGPPDPVRALNWLRAAAEQGDANHIHDLAVALEAQGAFTEAASIYGRARALGHLDASVSLGVLYQNGQGVEQDYAQARALYEGAAAAGHARAQNNLGLLYVRGQGVTQDYAKAAELFTAAAQQGLRPAMTNLGVLYDNGFGVPQSDETAAQWYRRGSGSAETLLPPIYDPRLQPPPQTPEAWTDTYLAAQAGDPVAQFLVGWHLAQQASQPPPPEAAIWFRAAATRGHAPAMANLARMHFLGSGVLQDYVQGQAWAILALAGGMSDAEYLAEDAGVTLSPEQTAEAQKLARNMAQQMAPHHTRIPPLATDP